MSFEKQTLILAGEPMPQRGQRPLTLVATPVDSPMLLSRDFEPTDSELTASPRNPDGASNAAGAYARTQALSSALRRTAAIDLYA
ncbi:MAG TPA: hypothetical protein VHW71_08065 [Steroidobacteraceae bacterium]|nr:hypothetical protein [Steroidobacteraceae bacterium]